MQPVNNTLAVPRPYYVVDRQHIDEDRRPRERRAGRAGSRHPGPLGVDDAGGRGAGGALPRDHVLARRRAERRVAGARHGIRRLRRAGGAGARRAAASSAPSSAACRTAGWWPRRSPRRYPERVAGLVLVSALPPSWRPDARARFFLRSPMLLLPLFLLSSLRLHREIAAAHGGWWRGVMAVDAGRGARSLTHFPAPAPDGRGAPASPAEAAVDGLAACTCRRSSSPARPALDRVVPTAAHGRVHAHLAARARP